MGYLIGGKVIQSNRRRLKNSKYITLRFSKKKKIKEKNKKNSKNL